jgi:hypothetical protein
MMMRTKINWIRIAFIFGVVSLIIGVIDPLEGSVLVALGSILLSVSTYMQKDPQWKFYLTGSVMIITGVSFLFYFSTLGGFGDSAISWWWGILILPYPLGWLLSVIMLILRIFKRQTSNQIKS